MLDPPFCEKCGRPYDAAVSARFECTNCRQADWHFTWARSAARAEGVLLEVIHRYKYNRARWFEPFLGRLLVETAAPGLNGAWDGVVPVPLHAVRQRHREFNQAEELGRYLARALGKPLEARFVRRAISTRSQTQLSREEREENVRGAFQVRKGLRLEGKRLVLVDDVFTTGATTNACAGALRRAGAAEVCVWTVARGG